MPREEARLPASERGYGQRCRGSRVRLRRHYPKRPTITTDAHNSKEGHARVVDLRKPLLAHPVLAERAGASLQARRHDRAHCQERRGDEWAARSALRHRKSNTFASGCGDGCAALREGVQQSCRCASVQSGPFPRLWSSKSALHRSKKKVAWSAYPGEVTGTSAHGRARSRASLTKVTLWF